LRLPKVFTARYFAEGLLTGGEVVPVRGSMFPPVVPLPFSLEVAPSILPVPGPDTLGEWHPLRAAYWRQLDRTGLETVATELRVISERHGGKPLVVADYEDVAVRGHRSPRVVFGRWWQEKTGEPVHEITADERRLSHEELHEQVRGRPRVPAVPPEAHALSWPLSHADIERWAEAVPWQQARSKENPHEYVLRRNVDPRAFELVVLRIREHGRQEVYAGYEYTRLDVGGHFLWTMGDSLPTTLLINRKPLGRDRTGATEAAATDASPGLFTLARGGADHTARADPSAAPSYESASSIALAALSCMCGSTD